MKQGQKGNFTIEASFIVPIILMMFVIIVYMMFYYHDKNILTGAAYETAVTGSGRKAFEAGELEIYFQKRIHGKLIFFSETETDIHIEKERITVECRAGRKGMRIHTSASARKTEPEKFIRNIRKLEMLGEIK